MADIDVPGANDGLSKEAMRLKREIRVDEAKLRLKRLEANKIDMELARKKTDYEIQVLKDEIVELDAELKEDKAKEKKTDKE